MKISNLEAVISCLKEWEHIRSNATEVISYLSLGNQFAFERTTDGEAALHAYPGICSEDQSFYLFLIDESQDRTSSAADLFEAITICKVQNALGNSDEIPEAVAQKRIATWRDEFIPWVTAQINLSPPTEGLFKAFHVPSSYLRSRTEYVTYFGLKEDNSSPTGYQADLITTDSVKKEISYYDTVRPVPPFDPVTDHNFYLLSLVEA